MSTSTRNGYACDTSSAPKTTTPISVVNGRITSRLPNHVRPFREALERVARVGQGLSLELPQVPCDKPEGGGYYVRVDVGGLTQCIGFNNNEGRVKILKYLRGLADGLEHATKRAADADRARAAQEKVTEIVSCLRTRAGLDEPAVSASTAAQAEPRQAVTPTANRNFFAQGSALDLAGYYSAKPTFARCTGKGEFLLGLTEYSDELLWEVHIALALREDSDLNLCQADAGFELFHVCKDGNRRWVVFFRRPILQKDLPRAVDYGSVDLVTTKFELVPE